MAEALIYWQQRRSDPWAMGVDLQRFNSLVEELLHQFAQLPSMAERPKILLAEPDPTRFLATFFAACASRCAVFLGNPNWAPPEWEQVFQQVQPDYVVGHAVVETLNHSIQRGFWSVMAFNLSQSPLWMQQDRTTRSYIMIPTGGSSGRIRFAIHTWETLMASVEGFKRHFQVNVVNSLCVLPLYHVSGLMQVLRSLTSGGMVAIAPSKELERTIPFDLEPSTVFLSLVPTQLQRLLQTPHGREVLPQVQTVLLGGAPAWADLLHTARQHQIRLALTYGMTETASQIATLKPDAFLQGQDSCGQMLPHAQITIRGEQDNLLEPNQIGKITIQARSLALGYYPNLFSEGVLQLDDLGFLDTQGNLHVMGRDSDKVITGGENVFPVEVEAAIRSTGLVHDVCVLGIGDRDWGQVITALYSPVDATVTPETLTAALVSKLSRFKHPKHWIPVESLPRNAQGKLNREHLRTLAIARLAHPEISPAS